jgi:hypothetical protein
MYVSCVDIYINLINIYICIYIYMNDDPYGRCVEDSLISIPAVRFDVFRDTCLGRAGCFGSGSNARHFIGDDLTKLDVFGKNNDKLTRSNTKSIHWGGSSNNSSEPSSNSGEFRKRRRGRRRRLNNKDDVGGDDDVASGQDIDRSRDISTLSHIGSRRRLKDVGSGSGSSGSSSGVSQDDEDNDGFAPIPKDEYKSGKGCFRCATRAIERYPLRSRVYNDSQFILAGEYKCIAMTKNDQHPSAREGYYPMFSGQQQHSHQQQQQQQLQQLAAADGLLFDKHGLGIDGGVNQHTRQRKCSSWNVRKSNPSNGTVPDSIAVLGLKAMACSQLRCRQTGFTSPQELMGMVRQRESSLTLIFISRLFLFYFLKVFIFLYLCFDLEMFLKCA